MPPVTQAIFSHRLKALPPSFRRLLVGVGIFWRGRFFSFPCLFSTPRECSRRSTDARAASYAVGLYTLHNVFYAGFAYASGWLSDHIPHRKACSPQAMALPVSLRFYLAPEQIRFLSSRRFLSLPDFYIGTEELSKTP